MKTTTLILILFLIYTVTSSFQCQKCATGIMRIGDTKSWLPLKGRTQLSFSDNSGSLAVFPLRVVDTTEAALNDCGGLYQFEYINTTLYLNQPLTDSIHFSLASSGWLCVTAVSNNIPNVSMCNIFGQTKEGMVAKKLNNYSVGSKTYPEAILLLSSPAFSNNIDSIVIANNAGIVAFRYSNRRFFLP